MKDKKEADKNKKNSRITFNAINYKNNDNDQLGWSTVILKKFILLSLHLRESNRNKSNNDIMVQLPIKIQQLHRQKAFRMSPCCDINTQLKLSSC